MIRIRKTGLRSLRTSVIFLIAIVITPIASLFLLRLFVVTDVICSEYNDVIKKIKSGKYENIPHLANIKEGIKLVRDIFCSFFKPMEWKTYVLNKKTGDLIEDGYSKTWNRENSPSEYSLKTCYYFLTNNKMIGKELDDYSKNEDLFLPNKDRVPADCVKREKDWKTDFKYYSGKLLDKIQQIVKEQGEQPIIYFPYNSKGELLDILQNRSQWELIAYLNTIISLEEGDYALALEWIKEYVQFLILLDEGSSYIFFYSKYILELINCLPFYYPFPEYFYEELIDFIIRLKNKYETRNFWRTIWFELFEVENRYTDLDMNTVSLIKNWYKSGEKFGTLLSRRKAYKGLSRIVAKYRPILESATWEDAEEAVFYKRGKLVSFFDSVEQHANQYKFTPTIYYDQRIGIPVQYTIPTLEHTKNIIYYRHLQLSYFYATITRVALEYYHSCYGVYPESLENCLRDYLKEEEITWINDSLDIFFYEDKYIIFCYPMPKHVKATLPKKHRFYNVNIVLPFHLY
ncbi:MAG TPA: hypothetical protein PLA12_02110 [Candidatus Hydrogenedens sp.]|nr:hypothetical protein [Candidatus Hydrogenedens sp.]